MISSDASDPTPANAPVVAAYTQETPLPEPRISLKIEDYLSAIVMGVLALITFANVLVRYFTHQSFAWTEEISIFLMIVLTLVAGSAATARNRNISIDYLSLRSSRKRQYQLAQFGTTLVAMLFLCMALLSLRMVWDDYRFEETSPGIGVPQWWYSIWLPILSFAISLRATGLLIRRKRQHQNHQQKNIQPLP